MTFRVFVCTISAMAGVACGLSRQDVALLRDAQELSLTAYSTNGPTTAAGQMDRAAFCAVETVLARNGEARVDAGAAIVCAARDGGSP